MTRKRPAGLRVVLWVVGTLALSALPAGGQVIRWDHGLDFNSKNVLQPRADVNKNLVKALKKAGEFRDKGDYDSAVEILQRYILDQKTDSDVKRLLDRSEDYFIDQSLKLSLKRQALMLIGELPHEGRRLYELKFGAVAQGMLDEAHDLPGLEEISRRYFHTSAGYEATYLIGTHQLDHGEPLAAALQFALLRELPEVTRRWEPMLSLKTAIAWFRAGETDRSVQTLIALKKASKDGRLALGRKTVTLFDRNGDAAAWLEQLLGGAQAGKRPAGQRQWVLFRGDAAHNAVSAPASPVWDSAWEFTTVRDPDAFPLKDVTRLEEVDGQLKQLAEKSRQSGFLTLPAAHPLIIGDAVVFRTLRNLRAIHLKTGELLWETAIVSKSYEQTVLKDSSDAARQVNQASPLEALLAQRGWRDLAAGTLSSNGRLVFALESTGVLSPYRLSFLAMKQHPAAATDYNRLVAYELATQGKLKWEVRGQREFALELAGVFFLGPPLPLDGHLYCLAEISGDVRLVVLEASTGKFEWSQTLGLPESALLQYPLRRLAGLMPAYSNGVLICPTTSGAVVAVDRARRMLLWGYRYSRSIPGLPSNPWRAMRMRAGGLYNTSGRDDEDRWLDAAPTIVDGKVLLTPRDSSELYCLNLVDGSLVWKKSRGQSLYLAGVYREQVILVGRTRIEALSLSDGKPLWDDPVSIEMPSGRGFRDGRFYRVPLSTGEIATIDLDVGRIIARSKSRTGEVLGNLVAAGGAIVSQSIDKIVGFRSLDNLQQQSDSVLVNAPDDAAALALRGEMLLHAGEEEHGLTDLRRSIELNSTSRSRELVVATLLEGLRHDFGKFRATTAEIDRLVENPRQRGRFLRLHAGGLQKIGEHQAAFREYLKLAAADTGKPELVRMNALLSVRSDRWVHPRIAEVYRKSSGADRDEMDQAIVALFDKAAETEADPKLIRKFLDAFVDLPVGDRAARILADRLDPSAQALQLELVLHRLRRAGNRETSGFATARLAALYIDRRQAVGAAKMLEALAARWNDIVCLNEKTGRQLVEEWRADENVAKLLNQDAHWPDRKIDVKKKMRRGAIQRFYPVKIIGPRGPMGENLSLVLDAQRRNLIAIDKNGIELWRLPISKTQETIPQNRRRNLEADGNYTRLNGHLMIVVFSTRFVVLDTLQEDDTGPRVLWQRELLEPSSRQGRNRGAQFQWGVGPGGVRVRNVRDRFGRALGKVIPIDESLISYQVGTRLIAADLLTGETLWERRSVPRGCDVFGDHEFVFVTAPNANETIVLRAADGKQVATRPLPEEETRLLIQGRHILVWTGRALQLLDVWTGKNRWERRVPPGGRAMLVADDEVAILNPHQGSLAIISIADGRFLVDGGIEKDAAVDSFLVRRSNDRYVVLTHSMPQKANAARVMALAFNHPLVNGYAYGFDRHTGKKLWTTRIEQQSIDVSQPTGLPMLIFAARTSGLAPRARLFGPNPFTLAVLDKRNGEIIYQESGIRSLSPFTVKVNPGMKRMEVAFYRLALELTMTNTPLASPTSKTPAASDQK